MNSFSLPCTKRSVVAKNLRVSRLNGEIPAVVYGHGFPSESIMIGRKDFERFLHRTEASPVVELVMEGAATIPVVVREVQRHSVSDLMLHVDFHRLRMEEKVTTTVPVEFTGSSKAVKDLGGVLVKIFSELTIECLPKDLISSIVVDVSSLNLLSDHIQIKDLAIPQGIEIKQEPDEMIVVVQEPKVEEVETAKPEADVAAVEVVGKKPKADVEEASVEEKKDREQ